MKILVTRRLTIRPPLEVDCDDLAVHLADGAVRDRLPCAPDLSGTADIAAWVKERCRRACAGEASAWTIHRERLIGVATLDGIKGEPKLGFFLAPAWSGHGLMAEALDAILAHAFETAPIRAVRSAAYADDPASLRLQEKLGFRVVGSRRAWSATRAATTVEFLTRLDRDVFATSGLARAA